MPRTIFDQARPGLIALTLLTSLLTMNWGCALAKITETTIYEEGSQIYPPGSYFVEMAVYFGGTVETTTRMPDGSREEATLRIRQIDPDGSMMATVTGKRFSITGREVATFEGNIYPDGRTAGRYDFHDGHYRTENGMADVQTGEGRAVVYDSRLGVTETFFLRKDEFGRFIATPVTATRGDPGSVSLSQPSGGLSLAEGSPYTNETWCIIVGISDYPGTDNDLPHDAKSECTLLLEALVTGENTERDHVVLLTDAQATKGALLSAFDAVGERAGPEDQVIFVFSGHGGQATSPGDGEADGKDEVLYLYGAGDSLPYLTDDDLAELLRQSRARVVSVFLDACHSGGFRDDLAEQPGRLGIFSSEEDLVSYTYYEIGLGGRLTATLLAAVSGGADADGDGQIVAGELRDFFYTAMSDIPLQSPVEGSRAFQIPDALRTVPFETPILRSAGRPGS